MKYFVLTRPVITFDSAQKKALKSKIKKIKAFFIGDKGGNSRLGQQDNCTMTSFYYNYQNP